MAQAPGAQVCGQAVEASPSRAGHDGFTQGQASSSASLAASSRLPRSAPGLAARFAPTLQPHLCGGTYGLCPPAPGVRAPVQRPNFKGRARAAGWPALRDKRRYRPGRPQPAQQVRGPPSAARTHPCLSRTTQAAPPRRYHRGSLGQPGAPGRPPLAASCTVWTFTPSCPGTRANRGHAHNGLGLPDSSPWELPFPKPRL